MKRTLQTLLDQHFDEYRRHHGVSLDQARAVSRIRDCRTARLGGHIQCCPQGHVQGVWYNSCKHRACPQCSGLPKERWLQHVQSVLLDCPHHHMIFTLPSELHGLWRFNRRRLTDLLFNAVHSTLKTFAKDPRYLAAMPGILSALHTWGRDLSLHPHLHCLISHGGLTEQGQWREPKKAVLFPQKPLMMVYRGKLLAGLKQALSEQELTLPEGRSASSMTQLCNQLGRKCWVVHCCARYDHASGVAKYLARYIKGGPLRNQQLRHVSQTHVTFSYQSHRSGKGEVSCLPVATFISRWLAHAPQHGKSSVRYLGLYSAGGRTKLNRARLQLGQPKVSQGEFISWQAYLIGCDVPRVCDVCGASLIHGDKEVPVHHAA
ncbi:IS91 family transposase [Corallincola spongiicola]|uniref:IS91 family transposase n=1 Tax=Corallincola spongiicola TaxID=2520508 RepID=A0ABY1WKA5_9GAMM|nr:IS91 family transposase [Corallincola spongiicola]TAA39176.1 IS91 family transposase [Corallincola spongiicola]